MIYNYPITNVNILGKQLFQQCLLSPAGTAEGALARTLGLFQKPAVTFSIKHQISEMNLIHQPHSHKRRQGVQLCRAQIKGSHIL
jgi:hypothetical protein